MMPTDPLDEMDAWFKRHCDDLWEHQNGITLETTDNPGWLVTIDGSIDEGSLNEVDTEIRKQWSAECLLRKHGKICVYAVSLKDCIHATAYVLSKGLKSQ